MSVLVSSIVLLRIRAKGDEEQWCDIGYAFCGYLCWRGVVSC